MNKKNLSVVLASAMLATSVAPVLADTTAKEYSVDDIKVLENELLSTMKKEMLTSNKALIGDGSTGTSFLSAPVATLLSANKNGDKKLSAYGVKILDEKGNVVGDIEYNIDNVGTSLAKVKPGYTVELVKRETTTFKGQLIPGTTIEKQESTVKDYIASDDFKINSTDVTDLAIKTTLIPANGVFVKSVEGVGTLVDADKSSGATANDYYNSVKVTTNVIENQNDLDKTIEFTLTKDNKKIDGMLPLDKDGNLLDYTKAADLEKFTKFEEKATWSPSQLLDKTPKIESTYKMVAATADENTYKAEELYDGVVLTAKGTELAADLENAKENKVATDKELVKIGTITQDGNVNKFQIYYYKNADLAFSDKTTIDGKDDSATTTSVAYKTVTVYSSNLKELTSLHGMLTPPASYEVGIVGGANRYATAVNVAKAQNVSLAVGTTDNIVLVNGSSLVDGLSAAPLASTVNGANAAAPVLLTKADTLPSETKEYIENLTSTLTSVQKKQITINLVGGESVLSKSLVKELEDMGFYVKRFGGENREATSLAVANELSNATDRTNDAFVVGGKGEADAMAISAVAASTKTPIIVSSVHGLSDDALSFLNENSAKADITIVGGESVVSKEEETAINESLSLNKATRVAGENRFETNAKIIEKYYKQIGTSTAGDSNNKGVEAIIVAKDGQANKGELVDALAAANYAAQKNAPIVLATNSLNAAQKNALLKIDTLKHDGSTGTKNSMEKAVQVGNGVERSVLEAVAGLFGLSNK